jgi:hypothetical protein
MNIIGRFRAKVAVDSNGCWIWQASKLKSGYGLFTNENRKTVTAHRWIWEYTHGAIPDEMVIDHICRNTSCVNPKHLQVITQSENIKRSLTVIRRSERTHCRNGHEFTPQNTKYVTGQRGRRCGICAKQSVKRARIKSLPTN